MFTFLRSGLARRAALADGAATFVQCGISVILGLFGSALLARTLGPADYGLFATCLSLATLLALAAQNGMPMLLIREIAIARNHKDSNTVRLALGWSLFWSLCVAGVLIAALIAVRALLKMPVGLAVLAMALIVPAVTLSRVSAAALTGFKRLALGQLPVMLIQPLVFICLVGLWWIGGHEASGKSALALRAGAEWIACALALALLLAHMPSKESRAKATDDPRRRWRASLAPLGLLVAANAINLHADIQILGLVSGVAEVGQYRVAAQIFAVAMSAVHIVASVTAPRIAAAHADNDPARVRRTFLLASAIVTALSLGFACVFSLAGAAGLTLVFGEAFAPSFSPALIMVWSVVVAALCGPAVVALNMLGQETTAARYALVCAGLNLLLNAVLIPPLGAIGAASATAVCLIVLNAVAWWRLTRKSPVKASSPPHNTEMALPQ